MASSKAAGRPRVRGKTEAFAFFFFLLTAVVTSEVAGILPRRGIDALRAAGIHDSVDLSRLSPSASSTRRRLV